MLGLEIEFLAGIIVARRVDDETALDWPPQPDRIFSALVASWGARGRNDDERAALEWLERQEPPLIEASGISTRSAPIVYVPPNDAKTSTILKLDVIPERRQRQGRRFPTGRPIDSTMRLVWGTEPDERMLAHLDAIARDTSYVGHSISLTRCRFMPIDVAAVRELKPPSRRVYQGRLEELERAFHASIRPSPGDPVASQDTPLVDAAIGQSVFSAAWVVLADDGGRAPDIRATAMVARKLRDALMAAWPDPIPEWFSGHDDQGHPSKGPHVAIIPLADVGWEKSEGRLMGFALVIPRRITPRIALEALGASVRRLIERSGEPAEGRVDLHYAPGMCWHLRPTFVPQRASLRAGRYLGIQPAGDTNDREPVAHVWATATPIALDRYPKGKSPDGRRREMELSIGAACKNIGLPEPKAVSINVGSSLRGSPASSVPRDAQPWQRWQLPRSLQGRHLVHATIEFEDAVQGPVVLGAGRFAGLGLCVARR